MDSGSKTAEKKNGALRGYTSWEVVAALTAALLLLAVGLAAGFFMGRRYAGGVRPLSATNAPKRP